MSGAGLGRSTSDDVTIASNASARAADQVARRVRCQAERDAERAKPVDQLERAGARLDLLADEVVHERGRLVDQLAPALRRPAQALGEVARGDVEAGADDAQLILARELAAVAAEELGLGLVPEGLGIQQQAIHVEDDGPIAAGQGHASVPTGEERTAGVGQRA
jgi:hypothetical protein